MSEIATRVLPQISASNGSQQSASRSREAATTASEGADAFSRVLDRQLSNRREAARIEDAARQRSAEGHAQRDQAAARQQEARPAQAAKAAKGEGGGKSAKAQTAKGEADAQVPAAAGAAVDGAADGRAAAAIAAQLPGLAAAAANDAGAAVPAADGVQTDLNADADAPARGKARLLGAGGGLRAVEGKQSMTGDEAAGETEPGDGAGFRARLEQLAGTDAAAGKSARVTRSQAGGEAPAMAAGAAVEADPLPAAAGSNDGSAAAISMQAAGGVRAHGAATGQPMPAYIATPAGQPGWAEDVGNRVVLLAGRDESAAELILTPPHLGRVEVSIRVSGEQTTAHFVAATPAARDALEQAMPRLREMLAEAGISLGDANVNTQAQQQRGDGGEGGGRHRPRYAGEIAGEGPVAVSHSWLRRSDGLIDTFA